MSTYINMSLKQLVIQKGIPFEVKLHPSTYTASEAVREVEAALQMEGMKLEEDELELLSASHEGKLSGDDIRRQILNEVYQMTDTVYCYPDSNVLRDDNS